MQKGHVTLKPSYNHLSNALLFPLVNGSMFSTFFLLLTDDLIH